MPEIFYINEILIPHTLDNEFLFSNGAKNKYFQSLTKQSERTTEPSDDITDITS